MIGIFRMMGRDLGKTLGRRLEHALCAAAFTVAAVAIALPAAAANSRNAAIIIDAQSRNVLYQENADEPRFPASLTKMMTLYLTFEALDEGKLTLDQRLPVSAWAQSMSPTKLGLREGMTVSVENAVLGLVTKSANDAAVVLAEALGGTEANFARMMTHKARSLGMNATTFQNASGLPNEGQVTTARDLSRLGLALINDHSKYYHYFSRRDFTYGGRRMPNHNHLMSRYEGMDGIKTGYIGASGFNLVASAVRDGRRLVGVVMGGKSAYSRDNRMAALLDDGFEKVGVARRGGGVAMASARDDDAGAAPPVRKPAAGHRAERPHHNKPTQTVVVKPERHPQRNNARSKDNWGIQVGAFSSRKAGQQAAATASNKAKRQLADAKARIEAANTAKGKVYRVRFVGLDERDARAACATLSKAGQHCAPVAPSDKS